MATVVGLVKSRLRNKSRRRKSAEGIDVLVDDGTGTLVRQKSLRQQALDPHGDDNPESSVDLPPRTPNDLDPALLADGLLSTISITGAPPVPPLPVQPPAEYFPTRRSSLQNRGHNSINRHRRAGSEASKNSMNLGFLPEHQVRRRHNTISSPQERPQPGVAGDYFSVSAENVTPQDKMSEVKAEFKTLTAKLYGSIAKKRRSIDGGERTDIPDSRSDTSNQTETPVSSSERSQVFSSSLAHRPKATSSHIERSIKVVNGTSPQASVAPPTVDDHLRLPPGFDLGSTEQTHVDITYHPAVEQEVIHHKITEIRQEVIERDIHIHHYYEYTQPIYVTEILPPKHYRLDPDTGEKFEIKAPSGWQLPQPFVVRKPDISDLKVTHRHYVVDEDHPNGIPEHWPLPQREESQTWV